MEVSWGCSVFVLLTIVIQIISETQLKSHQFAVLIYHPCLQVVGRCVCLATGGATVRVARVLVSNTRTRRMFAPFFRSFFFFSSRSGAACTKVSLIPLNMHSKLRNV